VSDIKWYIFKPIKYVQPIQLELANAIVAIDHQMAVTQIQVDKNFIDDVLIDGRFRVNIIIENPII
jgi:hypothetical protein